MISESTRRLINKLASGVYTEEERLSFMAILKTMGSVHFNETCSLMVDEISKYPADKLSENFKARLENRLNELERDKTFSEKAIVIPFWRRYAVAASALILFATGFYWLRNHMEKPIKAAKVTVSEALPGGNRAVLTLAGGTQIDLDSSKVGDLTIQPGVGIVKTDSGQILYRIQYQPISSQSFNILTTPRGGQFKVTLSDGTRVWLNAASSIEYPTVFSGDERKVSITGEAYFEVVHDKKRPFRVQVGEQIIEDIGTEFNVNAYQDEPIISTTVLRGSVRVSNRSESTILGPGQQAQTKGTNIKLLKYVDADDVVAWKNGFFSFRQADLPTVMRQLSRWYDVQVEYAGAIPNMKFGGTIARNTNASQVLKILEASKVHFQLKDKTILVTQ